MGEYANREIETFGYASPGFATSIQRHLLHWSRKWNPNFREFVESKQTAPGPAGYAVASERPLEDLKSNPYAIGIAAIMHVKNYPNVKVLARVVDQQKRSGRPDSGKRRQPQLSTDSRCVFLR